MTLGLDAAVSRLRPSCLIRFVVANVVQIHGAGEKASFLTTWQFLVDIAK